jgi:hypothetical protein
MRALLKAKLHLPVVGCGILTMAGGTQSQKAKNHYSDLLIFQIAVFQDSLCILYPPQPPYKLLGFTFN